MVFGDLNMGFRVLGSNMRYMGSYFNIPKAILYLLKGDYRVLGLTA